MKLIARNQIVQHKKCSSFLHSTGVLHFDLQYCIRQQKYCNTSWLCASCSKTLLIVVCHGHGCIANHKLIGCKGDSCRRCSLDDAREGTLIEAMDPLPLPYLLKAQSQRLDCILRNSGTIPAFSMTGSSNVHLDQPHIALSCQLQISD